jgi:hypothetical protein
VLALSLLAGLSALVVMAQVQSLLAAMHLPGEPAFTVHDVSVGRAEVAVRTWLDHALGAPSFQGPKFLTTVFVAVDTLLLVPAYAALLSLVLVGVYRRLAPIRRDPDPLLPSYVALLRLAFVSLPLLVVADVLENAALWLVVWQEGEGPRVVDAVLTVLWAIKWLLAAGIVIPAILGVVAVVRRSRGAIAAVRPTLAALRVQIVVVLFLAFLLFFPTGARQLDDVMRRWIGTDETELFAAAALFALLAAVIAMTSVRLLAHSYSAGATSVGLGPLAAAGVLLLVAGWGLDRAGVGGLGLAALGGLLLVIAALSFPIRKVRATPPPGTDAGLDVVPALLAALPPILLGLAAIRASVFELVYANQHEYAFLVLAGLVLQGLGWTLYHRVLGTRGRLERRATASPERRVVAAARRHGVLVAAGLVASAFAICVWVAPWWLPTHVGTLGSIAIFLVALVLLGYVALLFEYRRLAPPFFLVFGIRRFPVFLIAIAWALLAGVLDPGGYHDIRTIPRAAGTELTLERAWQQWLDEQPGDGDAIPLVLVAAEGGGIRAAYWTARGLDCALDADAASCGFVPREEANPGESASVFAASGVSGGSFGLAAYAASVLAAERGNWPDERLGEDFLAATAAWTLFADLPNGFLKLDYRPDRAGVLEEAWEREWDDPSPLEEGLVANSGRDGVPLLLLNGTSVEDGCRVNTSVLNVDVEEAETGRALRARDCLSMAAFAANSGARPEEAVFGATHDVVDLLCRDDDVRLSTAALLSARFPWVSPAGRVERCETPFATYVVDGGYFDTSAASPVQELWARLEPLVSSHNRDPDRGGPCVAPVLIQLDNHYKEPRNLGSSRRPWEAVAPILAVRAARDARENDARQAVALLFSAPDVGDVAISDAGGVVPRYAHLFPRAHPGTSAPLGWALSDASREDLTTQLGSPENANELGKIRRWFGDGLACEVAR